MQKLLTVVIPTYNMERWLERCLDSLVVADAPELMSCVEVLVVIDGATDSSARIARRYEDHWPQTFRVIEKANGNYGSCVNCGLSLANGKYIKVLDADDCFFPRGYRIFLERLANVDADMILTSGSNCSGDDTVRWSTFCYADGAMLPVEELRHVWIHEVTHRTDLLRRIGYRQTEGISYTDEEWVFYPMFAVNTFCAMDIDLYRYTVGREGQTMQAAQWKKAMANEIRVTHGMFDYLSAHPWRESRALNYVRSKMQERIEGFYRRALIECGMYGDEALADFDQWLERESPELWQMLDGVTAASSRFRFRYIHYWRSHGCCVCYWPNRFRLYDLWLKIRALKGWQ